LFALVVLAGCSHEAKSKARTELPSALAAGVQRTSIEPAPDRLRGRVALSSGARLYARPTYTSASWSLDLPEPPLMSGDGPARARSFRVVGIVRSTAAGAAGWSGDFVALTNDLDGEDGNAPIGCGPRFSDLDHLRMLVYVPAVHLAEVTTRPLELEPFSAEQANERLRLGAAVRVGPSASVAGLPALAEGARWRWIDADGIRTLAPIPDDAVGLAWDPGQIPTFSDAGEALMRDAEGSTIWLRDSGGDSLELTVRNHCAEHWKRIDHPGQVQSIRDMALELFYDQRPARDRAPAVEDQADYRIPAGTPLRWTDGELAGELLRDWDVAVGVGQSWDGRRCFALPLGSELTAVTAPPLICVEPRALELLATARSGAGFEVTDMLSLGGSIELGPFEVLAGGPWAEKSLQSILNLHHDGVSECLRPLLVAGETVIAARWNLGLTVTQFGRVDEVEIDARGQTHDAVEDCLRAEVFTWLLPEIINGEEVGRLTVPLSLGRWTVELEQAAIERDAEAEAAKGKAKGKPKAEPKGAGKQPAERERGKVVIIRDEDPDSLE